MLLKSHHYIIFVIFGWVLCSIVFYYEFVSMQ